MCWFNILLSWSLVIRTYHLGTIWPLRRSNVKVSPDVTFSVEGRIPHVPLAFIYLWCRCGRREEEGGGGTSNRWHWNSLVCHTSKLVEGKIVLDLLIIGKLSRKHYYHVLVCHVVILHWGIHCFSVSLCYLLKTLLAEKPSLN